MKPLCLSSVLGLNWNRDTDTLEINTECLKFIEYEVLTKKSTLSGAHKLFDVIVATRPAVLWMKIFFKIFGNIK